MAENFVGRWGINTDGTQNNILSTANIHNLLDHVNTFSKSEKDNINPELAGRIQTLKIIADNYEQREQKIYKKYKCENINDLQKKIDEINEELLPFQNKVLSTFPLVKEIDNTQVSLEAATDKLLAILQQEIKEKSFKEVLENLQKNLQDKRTLYGNNANVSLINLEKIFVFDGKKAIRVKTPKALQGYRREVTAFVTPEGELKGEHLQFNIALEEPSMTELKYYPYFKLTKPEQDEAKNISTGKGKQVWDYFKKSLVALTGSRTSEAAMRILNEGFMTPEDFFISSSAELKGIMGEFQTMVLFATLENSTGNLKQWLTYVGNQLYDGKKVGVDIALGKDGIQVKNYKMVGKSELFNLNDTYKLDGFLEQLKSTLSQDQLQTIAEFYTVRAYHVSVNKDFKDTRSRLLILEERLKNFYSAYINYFLPLDAVPVEDFRAANLFYFVGGKKMVPVSAIIKRTIHYLEGFLKGQVSAIQRDFTANFEYHGETYKNYYNTWPTKKSGSVEKQRAYEESFSYGNIYNQISIRQNYRFNVGELVKMALEDLKNS